MKYSITYPLATLLLLATTVVSCSKEDVNIQNTTPAPMTISVVDSGYTAIDNTDAKSRANDNGYITTFTVGDQIGLYIVKSDGSYAHENVALTLTDIGAGVLSWQAPVGTILNYEGATAKYFTYYPYQAALNGTLTPTATSATDFFADVVKSWIPALDQGTYAKYTASDLMVGSGTATKKADGTYALSFTLTHAMALVVIEIPQAKYTLTNVDGDSLPDYYITAPDTKFYGFTPYSPSLSIYRQLVKPSQSNASDLVGSYTTADGKTKSYIISANTISAANYVRNKVDGGAVTIIAKSHVLQIGDFYLKNGDLLGKDATLTADQKASCLGIVFKVGRDDEGACRDDCTYKDKEASPMNDIHGYVLALNDANGADTCQWSSSSKKIEHPDMNREFDGGFYGYKNTNAIKEFAALQGMTLQGNFSATHSASVDYEASYPAPKYSSGWFLPSIGQCAYWIEVKDTVLNGVKIATDNPNYDWQKTYWSSTELVMPDPSGVEQIGAFFVLLGSSASIDADFKESGCYVRSLLTF